MEKCCKQYKTVSLLNVHILSKHINIHQTLETHW